MPIVLDGKAVSKVIKENLVSRVAKLKKYGISPKLTIFTNTDPASEVYVRNKVLFGEYIGAQVDLIKLDKQKYLDMYSNRELKQSSPYIVQLPLDKPLKELLTMEYAGFIEADLPMIFGPDYDMDYFGREALGGLFIGSPTKWPCTPAGIIHLLSYYNIDLENKTIVVAGRSNIVGRPLTQILSNFFNATVINVHSHTPALVKSRLVNCADIIISATGNRKTFESCNLSDKVIVDVGMNRDENGKLCGDIGPEWYELSKAYTPVPGGVGPMTVAMLFSNVVDFYEGVMREELQDDYA